MWVFISSASIAANTHCSQLVSGTITWNTWVMLAAFWILLIFCILGALQPPTATTLNWQHVGKFKMSPCYFLSSKITWTWPSFPLCISMFVSSFFSSITWVWLFCVCLSVLVCCFPLSSAVLHLSTGSTFCLLSLSLWRPSPAKGNLLTGLVAFLCLFSSHSVSRQLSLCGFWKKRGRGRWEEE